MNTLPSVRRTELIPLGRDVESAQVHTIIRATARRRKVVIRRTSIAHLPDALREQRQAQPCMSDVITILIYAMETSLGKLQLLHNFLLRYDQSHK